MPRCLSRSAIIGAVVVCLSACSSSEGTGGSGGSSPGATGGAPSASGGSTGTGGSSTGGTMGSGGSIGSGAATGTGGTAGSGGKGTAGAAGAAPGGASGAGGNRGSGGAAAAGGVTGGSGGAQGGGGSGGHPGGGAAGSGAYNPCSAHSPPCKVLPLGDSITYGVNDEGNGGYRGPLFAAVVAAGQQITFTGSLTDGPATVSGQPFPPRNEGHSGWGISEVTTYSNGNAGIATVIPTPAFSSSSGGTPDVILLHIGTNDSGQFTATQMTSDLQGLLNKLFTNAPSALVVVAQIIPLGYGTNSVIKAYNQSIPGLVQTFAAAGKHVMTVDMYTGFNTSTMLGSDSIHPNTTGYTFMADHWYSAIGSLLPK
jgi:GDSL-like Lipase/Acylhydrolase family